MIKWISSDCSPLWDTIYTTHICQLIFVSLHLLRSSSSHGEYGLSDIRFLRLVRV